MATKKTTVRRDVACISIGHMDYLLDADKAMQAMKLFREALECRRYLAQGSNRFRYVTNGRPELELTLIDACQVDIANNVPALEDQHL